MLGRTVGEIEYKSTKKTEKRDGFSSRFRIIAAAAESVVTLVKIWKLTYIDYDLLRIHHDTLRCRS